MRAVVVRLAIAALALTAGCSLLLELDGTGHPCDGESRCIEGYVCDASGICIRDPDEPIDDPCGGACSELERCDRDSSTCRPICEGAICGTGEVCLPAAGGCTPIVAGVGQLCRTDAECEGILADCSGSGGGDSGVVCACVVPATMADAVDPQGVCLGLPVDAEDCGACGDAYCLRAELSSGGASGLPGERAVCVPAGLSACRDAADCSASESPTVCTYLGWPLDPGLRGYPEGLFSACLTPSWEAAGVLGDPCDPDAPLACDTGLCVPASGGGHVCTGPCVDDGPCENPGSRCLEAPVAFGQRGDATGDRRPLVWDVARVCGQGPSLGEACDTDQPDLSQCTTDAPSCVDSPLDAGALCSRPCRKDTDCGADPAYGCTVGSDVCLPTGS